MLLLLEEEDGSFAAAVRPGVDLALAGGVLMDLAFESRIDTDLRELVLLDAAPTGDSLLDPVLADIAAAERRHDARYWVERTRARAPEIRGLGLARLLERGLLHRRRGRFPAASRRRPVVDRAANRAVRGRVKALLFGDGIPEPRDVVVICLSDVCGIFDSLLAPTELKRLRPRIRQLGRMDLIGQAVAALVGADLEREGAAGLQSMIAPGVGDRLR